MRRPPPDLVYTLLDKTSEALDRMRAAQTLLKRDGLVLKGRAHPASVIERDARLAMLRAVRQLGLDLEPVRDQPGRPPGGGGRHDAHH
jgi:hypothetical protein